MLVHGGLIDPDAEVPGDEQEDDDEPEARLRVVLSTFLIFPKRRVVSTPWPTTLQNSMVLP